MTPRPKTTGTATNVESPGWLRSVLVVVAGLCVGAGVFRMARLGAPPDRDVLFFFLAGVVVLLADSVKKFKFGDMEFERVQRLEERVQELADVQRAPTVALTGEPLVAPAAAARPNSDGLADALEAQAARLAETLYKPPLGWEDDPVARKKADVPTDGSTLTAKVSPSKNYEDRFRVAIDLEVGADVNLKSDERVAFFLHHSFPEKVQILPVEHRHASLVLISGGSFTVGALLPDGTFLSLDLTKADLSELTSGRRRFFLAN